MRKIIDNLTRQHHELTRLTMTLVPLLEPQSLASNASPARRTLHGLTGVLKVHLSMEDRSFYPSLVDHRDPDLRQLARKFLDERAQIQTAWLAFIERWIEPPAIERAADAFVAEARDILFALGQRMVQEDKKFHPQIVARWDCL